MRIFQEAVFETFFRGRVFRPQNAGDQAGRRLDQRHRGDFSARQHKIAERHLLQPAGLDHPFVQPLEPAAEQNNTGPRHQFTHAGLGQRRPARGQIERRPGRAGLAGGIDGRGRHIGPHHHAGATPGRCIVYRTMFAVTEIADIPHLQRPQAFTQRPADQRLAERPRKHFGIKGEDGCGPHHRSSLKPSWLWMKPRRR